MGFVLYKGRLELTYLCHNSEADIARYVTVQRDELERIQIFADVAPELVATVAERIQRCIRRHMNHDPETADFELMISGAEFCWKLTWNDRGLSELHKFKPDYSDYFVQEQTQVLMPNQVVKRTGHVGEYPFIDFPWILSAERCMKAFKKCDKYDDGFILLSGPNFEYCQGFPNCDKIKMRMDGTRGIVEATMYNSVLSEDQSMEIAEILSRKLTFCYDDTSGSLFEVQAVTFSPVDDKPQKLYNIKIDCVEANCEERQYEEFCSMPLGLTVSDYRFWNGQPTQYLYEMPPSKRQFIRMAERMRMARAKAAGCSCDMILSDDTKTDIYGNIMEESIDFSDREF